MERDVQAQAMLDISRGPIRLFRNNVGVGWAGKLLSKAAGKVTLGNARPLHAGLCTGSSDAIGWFAVEITQAMVGKKVAVFAAVEFKGGGQPTPEQTNFIQQVRQTGGVAGVARSSADAHQLFIDYLTNLGSVEKIHT